MTRTQLWGLRFAAIALCIVLALALIYKLERPTKYLPVLGHVPAFTLTDSRNMPLTQNDLKGKVWVASFVFTRCQGPCPTLTAHLATLYRSYELEPNVALVSISVDPLHDTPGVLAAYAKKFNADPQKWHLLTGSESAIIDLITKGFKVGDDKNLINHSTRFVLVDANLDIRGYYDGMDKDAIKNLFQDIAMIKGEQN